MAKLWIRGWYPGILCRHRYFSVIWSHGLYSVCKRKFAKFLDSINPKNTKQICTGQHSTVFWVGWVGGAGLVSLEFNGPTNTIKVMSSQSVYLTIFFLGRFSPLMVNQYFCTFFHEKLTTAQ